MSETARNSRRKSVLEGPIRRTVFILALPVLIEQTLNFFVGYYDTYLSGRLSALATETVGLSAYFGWLAGMLFAFVGVGTTALVSRHWGAGEHETANIVLNRSLAIAALTGFAVYALIFLACPWAAWFLDLSPKSTAVTIRYLRLDSVGHLFTGVTLIGAAALRGAGHMRVPMVIFGTVGILNMLVSGACVYGIGPVPPLGIDGILVGTVVARFTGSLLMLALLVRGFGGLKLKRSELRLRGENVRRIIRIGVPAAADGMVMWFGQFLFLMVVSRVSPELPDSVPMAAHMIGIRVEAITYLPAVAWGAATATIVGQSLGAGQNDRARSAPHEAIRQCGLLATVITLVFLFGADWIFHQMHTDADVIAEGVPAFRLLALFQIPLVISIIHVQSLRGAGDSRFPMWVTLLGVCGVRVPLAWFCGLFLDGGLLGAWIGMAADILIRCGILAARVRSGKWLETRV